jgi:hypothetical protein
MGGGKMTDKQINAAIAKACGICHSDEHGPLYKTDQGWVVDCPNYCTDLNAMREAEETLKGKQFGTYGIALNDIEGSLWGIRATARQRAEAFLRTLGKWEEGE